MPLPIHYGFLLVSNFSMIAYASAIESLRLANRESGKELYQWTTATMSGEPIKASNEVTIVPDMRAADCRNVTTLFVCSGIQVPRAWTPELASFLKEQAAQKVAIGGLCTGAYILAKSGLLDGYQATLHWANLATTREEFPNIRFTEDLFEIDRDRYTCAGGTAPIDMMLRIIREDHGQDMAAMVSEILIIDRIRCKADRQRIPLRQRIGTSQPKLTEAVMLMESNLEEPITPDELASYVKISRRQLERLFRKYLDCTPTRYYLDIRLANARRLLLQTEKSILEISMDCGFVSAPHFSKCYRDLFGLPPREERRLLLDRRVVEAPVDAESAGKSTD